MNILPRMKKDRLSVYFTFQKGPWGGGNQFLKNLLKEAKSNGTKIDINTGWYWTASALFNSHHFNEKKLKRLKSKGTRMVHRVDGPLLSYRGMDDGTDAEIARINNGLADATIVQSQYSLDKHEELGIHYRNPVIIPNAADPTIFYRSHRDLDRKGPIRLVSTSWSPNWNKGFKFYKWMEENLDPERYQHTFIGNSPVEFNRTNAIDAMPSTELANFLRTQDIYVTASLNDPCSNSVIEAMSCGLPVLYLNSGGHPELVQDGGLPFKEPEDIPAALDRIVNEYEVFKQALNPPSISDVWSQYKRVLFPTVQ